MNKFQKIFVLILTLLVSKTIWNREIILKKFHKTNITLENRKSINKVNNSIYAYVLYYDNEVFFREGSNDKWKIVLPHDELNIEGEIKIDNDNGLILLEIENQNIMIKGLQKTKKIIDIIRDQKIEKRSSNESSSLMNFFIVPDDFKKTKVGSVERGFEEKKELNFFPKNTKDINVLKNTNTIILWEKKPYYTDEYKLEISHYFNPKLDTFLFYKDTSIALDLTLTSECYPCEIKIIEPKNRYKEITLVTKKLSIENEKIYKSLLNKINNENEKYSKVALINFLTKYKFYNTAFFYLNKFYLEDKENKYFKDEYQYYIKNILQ